MSTTLVVEEWDHQHERWHELLQVVETLNQSEWVAASFVWHHSSHMLVAHAGGVIAGFLRFVVQAIGPEDDHAPITLDGLELTEAKILAFGVIPAYRRRGIGQTLQEQALLRADQLGCYQLRSHSGGANVANHRLKLTMGFGVHPVVRGADVGGAYFIMPLRAARPRPPAGKAVEVVTHPAPQTYTLTVGAEADAAFRKHLQSILRAYNERVSAVRGPDSHPLTIRVTDHAGRLVGGLVALTYWAWLDIDVLALEPWVRGQGLGTRLMDQAEAIARDRGCIHAHTSTYAYQALGFYQRHGYRIVGQLDDYPEGYSLMWLRKEL